ncbi:MAG: hypothetical protein AB7F35_12655 [Acetobacteraceae bacterium]
MDGQPEEFDAASDSGYAGSDVDLFIFRPDSTVRDIVLGIAAKADIFLELGRDWDAEELITLAYALCDQSDELQPPL